MSHNSVSMTSLLQDIVALLAITNPLGALPVFVAITERLAPAERPRAGLRAAFAVTIILAVAALAGRPVLAAFGISMPALQAAGGLVVLLMGLEMLRGAPTRFDSAPVRLQWRHGAPHRSSTEELLERQAAMAWVSGASES